MKKILALCLTLCMLVTAAAVTTLSSAAEDDMLIRYHDMWDYVVYADDTTHAAPEGWLDGTDTETWTTARDSIGAQSWGNWNSRVSCQYYTMFLRKDFTVDDASAVTGLTFYFLYDEDPVVYINGSEVLRLTGYHDADYAIFNLDQYVDLLHDGVNTMQIEIINNGGGGGCGMALVCSKSTSSVKGVAKGSVWEYSFINNDSAAPAPAGFIEGQAISGLYKAVAPFTVPAYKNNTTDNDIYTILPGSTMTTWFRQFFDVADASKVVAMTMDLKYDEDPIVYINGTQVYSATGYRDSVFTTVSLNDYVDLLTDGANCVAVRMVNAAGGGGSIFDMSLEYNDTGYDENGYIIPASASCENVYSFGDLNKAENIIDGDNSSVCGDGDATGNRFTVHFRKAEMITEVYTQCKNEGDYTGAEGFGHYGYYNIYANVNGKSTLIGENVPAIIWQQGGYNLVLDKAYVAESVTVEAVSWQGPGWACLGEIKVKATGEDVYYDNDGCVLNLTATCENVVSFGALNDPSNILDGDQGSVCGSGFNADAPQTFTVTFPRTEYLKSVYLQCKYEGEYTGDEGLGHYGYYNVYAVSGGVETLIGENVPAIIAAQGGYTLDLAAPVKADAVKVVVASWQGPGWACLADIRVTAHTFDEHGVCTDCHVHKPGDANGDNDVTIADVTALLNYLRGDTTATENGYADINGDGVCNVSDLTAILDLLGE